MFLSLANTSQSGRHESRVYGMTNRLANDDGEDEENVSPLSVADGDNVNDVAVSTTNCINYAIPRTTANTLSP